MRICVTKKDIENGIPKHAKQCPLAITFKRSFPLSLVCVLARVWIDGSSYQLPEKAMKFKTDFDNNRPVKPFWFEVEI